MIKDLCDEECNIKAREKSEKVSPITIQRSIFLRSFVLDRLNPRLDSNVTTATNHLLKSPFCVHPKTGSVAVPFTLDGSDKFNVTDVPRVE
jgi:DNA primase catalytic subunit